MDTVQEMERVVRIAKALGAEHVLRFQSRVTGFRGVREYIVELVRDEGAIGLVRVANFEQGDARVHLADRSGPTVPWGGPEALCDIVVPTGSADYPPGLATVAPVAEWLGVGTRHALDVHDRMVRSASRARRAAVTRSVHQAALRDALLRQTVRQILANPTQSQALLDEAKNAARDQPEHVVERMVADALIDEVGIASALHRVPDGRLGAVILDRAFADAVDSAEARFANEPGMEIEGRRSFVWSLLEAFPLRVRCMQAEVLLRASGVPSIDANALLQRLDRVEQFCASVTNRAQMAIIVMAAFVDTGVAEAEPWSVVSAAQTHLVESRSGGRADFVIDTVLVPYETEGHLFSEVRKFLASPDSGLAIEFGALGLDTRPDGESVS